MKVLKLKLQKNIDNFKQKINTFYAKINEDIY